MITLGRLAPVPNGFLWPIHDGTQAYFPVLRETPDTHKGKEDWMISQKGFYGDHFVCHKKYASNPNTSYQATMGNTRYIYQADNPVKGSSYDSINTLACKVNCLVGETLAYHLEGPILMGYPWNHGEYAFRFMICHCKHTGFNHDWWVDEFALYLKYDGTVFIRGNESPYPHYGLEEYVSILPFSPGGTSINWSAFWRSARTFWSSIPPLIEKWCLNNQPINRKTILPNEGFAPHNRPKLDGSGFLFNEPSFNTMLPNVQNVGSYMILKEAAYKSAIDSMPKLNDNSISNALEVASFMKSLVMDHKIEIPKTLKQVVSDAWLGYRYSYSTTTLDAEETVKYITRRMAAYYRDKTSDIWLPSYGSSSLIHDGVPVTMKCRVRYNDRTFHEYEMVWDKLYEYGLQPNLYVVWDMIPFSFVVDWFLPIGDIASAMDASGHLPSLKCKLDSPLYSLTYEREEGDYRVRYYTRYVGSAPSYLVGGVFADNSVSKRTKFKRFADAFTLFT